MNNILKLCSQVIGLYMNDILLNTTLRIISVHLLLSAQRSIRHSKFLPSFSSLSFIFCNCSLFSPFFRSAFA